VPTDEWTTEGYQDARGRRPVGVELGMPYARPLTGKLWELRVSSGRLDYRLLYFAHTGHRFVLLHAFSKKTRRTPRCEIEIALRRMAELLEQKE
jgi:phage-related protein